MNFQISSQVWITFGVISFFFIHEFLDFKYKKDSVLVVTDEESDKCQSSHPILFSNNGDTAFTLDHSGLFYFISGDGVHFQKMIINVLEIESPPPPARGNQNGSTSDSSHNSGVSNECCRFFPALMLHVHHVILWLCFQLVLVLIW